MPRASVRDLWKAKIEGRSIRPGAAAGAQPTGVGVRRPFHGLVLGIDPSLRGTGIALVDFIPGRGPVLLHSRTVTLPPSRTMPECLAGIFNGVTAALADREVRHVALEQTIYVQNFQTAQILGAARGAAIAAAAVRGMPVFEYPPLRIKQAVVGVGRASKEQVARTVRSLLGHGRTLASDEADAAAVALCHAFTWRG